MPEAVEEAQRRVGRLAAPQGDEVTGILLDLGADRVGHVGDAGVLPLEHVADVDVADIGDDQLQEQFAAQVAEVDHGRGEPLPELGAAGSCRGEDGAIPAGDARLFTNRLDVAADSQLFERAIGERPRQ